LRWENLRFSEEDNPVGVGAFLEVGDAPAVAGLGEFLVVDEDEDGDEAGAFGGGDDVLFQLDFTVADLADFEGDVAAFFEDVVHALEGAGHGLAPGGDVAENRDVDGVGVDAVEPATQPVVASVVDDVEEGGRGDDEADAFFFEAFEFVGGADDEGAVGAVLGEGGAVVFGEVLEEGFALFEDDFFNVAVFGGLLAFFVDAALALGGDGLVGGQGVDGEEAFGVSGEAVGGDHADPGVDGVELGLVEEVLAQGEEFAEGVFLVEGAEVVGEFAVVGGEVEFVETGFHFGQGGGREARGAHDGAEGVDVAAYGGASGEGGFHGGGAAAHEGVEHGVAFPGEAVDEKAGELGLEAGAVGDFVEAVGGALLGGPEFVDVDGDGLFAHVDGVDLGLGAEVVELADVVHEGGGLEVVLLNLDFGEELQVVGHGFY